MDMKAKIRVDRTVAPDVETLLKDWNAYGDLSVVAGLLEVGIFFRKEIKLPGIELIYLTLHPMKGKADWYWYAHPINDTLPSKEGQAGSLAEAIAAAEAAAAEIKEGAPA
jgi:hypothetical protein